MCGRYALGDGFEAVQGRVNAEYFGQRRERERRRRREQRGQQGEEQDDNQQRLAFQPDEQAQDDAAPVQEGGEEVEAAQGDVVVEWAPGTHKDKYRPRFNVAPQTLCPVIRYVEPHQGDQQKGGRYVIELMKWGLVPHWQKEPPTQPLKTINCRDDTLFSGSGMWAGLRGRNRCIVIAQGFFEWLKKDNAKIPHFTKPADGKYMMMAGLWDQVKYQGTDEIVKTFTIITTSSNQQLGFLHDRMPAILSDSDEIMTWLKPAVWTTELQQLIRPFSDKLECYKVPQEVGSVKNDSPDFIKPISERKGNLASFFAKSPTKASTSKSESANDKSDVKKRVQDEETKADMRLNPDDVDALPSTSKTSGKSESSPGKRERDSSVEVIEGEERKPSKSSQGDKSTSPPSKKKKRVKSPPVDDEGNTKMTSFFKKET